MIASPRLDAACRVLESHGGAPISSCHGPVPEALERAAVAGPMFVVAERRFLLRVPNGMRVLVEDGTSVTIDCPSHLSDDDQLLWVLGSAWGALAYQRGLLPMHLSAVQLGDGIAGFGGRSGAGKSTLAAALATRGHTLAADDVTGVDASAPGRPMALPGHKTLKLWGDATTLVGVERDRPVRTDAPMDKYYVAVGDDGAERHALPLRRIYQLIDRRGQPDGEPEFSVEQRKGGEAVVTLESSIYRPAFGDAILGRRRIFELLAVVAAGTDVFAFGRPMRKDRFWAGVDVLEDHLSAGGRSRPTGRPGAPGTSTPALGAGAWTGWRRTRSRATRGPGCSSASS
jgi:hypothetical protein